MSEVSAVDTKTPSFEGVADIRNLPFAKFAELQSAVAERRFSLGIDPLAAAEWSDNFSGRATRFITSALSLLLLVAALASVVAAVYLRNYWLLLALPVQAVVFFFSSPSSRARSWATVLGVASVLVFVNLLLNRLTTAATLAAYCALTFAAVRAAGFIANSAFRKALLSDESLFVAAYSRRACSVRDNKSERVYAG